MSPGIEIFQKNKLVKRCDQGSSDCGWEIVSPFPEIVRRLFALPQKTVYKFCLSNHFVIIFKSKMFDQNCWSFFPDFDLRLVNGWTIRHLKPFKRLGGFESSGMEVKPGEVVHLNDFWSGTRIVVRR